MLVALNAAEAIVNLLELTKQTLPIWQGSFCAVLPVKVRSA
jgi:hypothetical protein